MNKKIEVNALMSFDNIKIIATIKQNSKVIKIHDEKIKLLTNNEKINVKKNIKNALKSIEEKTSTKVKEVNIIFDDFMKNSECLKISTRIVEDIIEYPNEKFLSLEDTNAIINSAITKAKEKEDDIVLISVVPFKFSYVETRETRETESSSFPIGKKISKLKVNFSIRYMDKENYLKTIDYFDSIDIKVNNIALESQLAIYNNQAIERSNKINFVLAIKDNKTVLISNTNNIAIKTDNLNYSIENLIKKVEENFDVTFQEAKNLIDCYGDLNFSENEKNEIIYSSYSLNSELSKPIRRSDINEIIKSFLKSICVQANEIIQKMLKNNFTINLDLTIVGKLSRINDISNYCSKYFEKINIFSNEQKESIYAWNDNFVSVENYWLFLETIDNKINPQTFYYNNSNKNKHNKNNVYKKDQVINTIGRIPNSVLV